MTFSLTQGADNKVGTSADETFTAYVDNGVASFQYNLDTINGGTGTDTLVAYGQGVGATAVSLSNITNIEKFHLRATAASNFNMATTSGYTELKNDGSSAALTFSSITSTTPKLVVHGATDDASFLFSAAAVAGGSDSISIEVNGYNASSKALFLTDAVETVNISSTGAASSFILAETGAANSDLDTTTALNITGSANLALGDDNLLNVKTVTADTFTGSLTLNLTSNAVATGTTVKTGSGNDFVLITGTELSKATGAADNIDLGSGTGDVLGVAGALSAVNYATFVDAANSVVKNTEGVRFNSKQINNTSAELTSFDATAFTNGIKNFIFNAASATGSNAAANIAITGLVTANSLTFNEDVTGHTGTAAGENAVSVTGASAGQTANLILGGATITGGAQNGGDAAGGHAFVIGSGISKVVITSNTDSTPNPNAIVAGAGNGNGAESYAFSSTNLSSVELNGATNIEIKGVVGTTAATLAGFSAGVNLDATNFTGASTIYLSADATTGDIFTGGTGADKVFGLAGNDSLTGNAGNDSLAGGAGKDTLSGGDGDDVLLTGVYGVAGGTDAAAAEVLTGGAGTDKFYIARPTVTNTTAANISSNAYVVSDFNATGEKLYLAANSTPTGGTHLLDADDTLTDMSWNAAAGVTAASSKVINIGSLATDVGSSTVAGDLQAIIAATASAGKIGQAAAAMNYVVFFNSARDSATYAAVITESGGTAGWTGAEDNMTLVKLTGVAVADLAAADLVMYTADPF